MMISIFFTDFQCRRCWCVLVRLPSSLPSPSSPFVVYIGFMTSPTLFSLSLIPLHIVLRSPFDDILQSHKRDNTCVSVCGFMCMWVVRRVSYFFVDRIFSSIRSASTRFIVTMCCAKFIDVETYWDEKNNKLVEPGNAWTCWWTRTLAHDASDAPTVFINFNWISFRFFLFADETILSDNWHSYQFEKTLLVLSVCPLRTDKTKQI